MYKNVKVECFGDDEDFKLEDSVNEWLNKNMDKDIIDIKFSNSICVDERKVYEIYSAFIIYKD